jgi:hydrogenase maturation protease
MSGALRPPVTRRPEQVGGLVVIGVGNRFARDDALGLCVVDSLRARTSGSAPVRFVELDGEPSRIVAAWRHAAVGWLVDAMASGRAPGDVVELDLERLEHDPSDGRPPTSSHATGAADAIALGRALDALPGRVRVFGVEGAAFGPGEGLTPAVRDRLGAIVDHLHAELVHELARLGGSAEPRR